MDIDAIKSKLATLQSTSNTKDNFWKPEPGKQVVRIVPYKFNKDNPFIELFFHYNLNNRSYLSPISFGRPDPIEEFAQKLKSTGSKDDYRLGRKIEAKMRTFAPVIVRGEENQGVKFWGFGKTVYQELLSAKKIKTTLRNYPNFRKKAENGSIPTLSKSPGLRLSAKVSSGGRLDRQP